ncbi:MAG TPA: helix-turn-helix transcriptional regulator [Micropepsaceae bacterium]|nr:helix-turn-helix transcriptional regulator [Micropepsaceae bacterium]
MAKKSTNNIDVHVGARMRLRRMLIGMSQEKLGETLGLTFQQVQKYEKGANRIGASRLFHIAQILSVPVSFFFEDLSQADLPKKGLRGFAEDAGEETENLIAFLSTPEGMQLNRAFTRISDAKLRRRILDLVVEIAGQDD